MKYNEIAKAVRKRFEKPNRCVKCAVIQKREIDGESVSWCPISQRRVSGSDKARECWISHQEMEDMMDALGKEEQEQYEGALEMDWSRQEHLIDEKEKVTK